MASRDCINAGLTLEDSPTNAEKIFTDEAVALFPVAELDLPDLEVVPQVEDVVDGLLGDGGGHVGGVPEGAQDVDEVLGVLVDEEDAVLVKVLLHLPLHDVCQAGTAVLA